MAFLAIENRNLAVCTKIERTERHNMKISERVLRQVIGTYRHRAIVVREIHSGIAQKRKSWDLGHSLVTVALGAIITFIGFMGPDRLWDIWKTQAPQEVSQQTIDQNGTATSTPTLKQNQKDSSTQNASNGGIEKRKSEDEKTKKIFDFVFNAATLSLFIASLLNLIFRWKEDHYSHFQGVVKLTQFLNWLDELECTLQSENESFVIKEIRLNYRVIVEQLPPNDRKEYLSAKKRLAEKNDSNEKIQIKGIMLDNECTEKRMLIDALIASPVHFQLLKAMCNVSPEIWLGGGAVRNFVWDMLTGSSTKFDDFDVVFYENIEADSDCKVREVEFENKLHSLLPNVLNISVRNQARMHFETHEPARSSLVDAISNWPETATAIAVRILPNEDIEIIAPYGFDDLFNFVIKATPYHKLHPEKFEERRLRKNWVSIWPQIKYEN